MPSTRDSNKEQDNIRNVEHGFDDILNYIHIATVG